jgi:2-keto-3-deoxy-L-fuconate dehydrogenase
MSSIFGGKSALITGAASGIGAATARHLCDHGTERLILFDRNEAPLKQHNLRASIQYIIGDVSDEALWADNAHILDDIDYAVLNAGIAHAGAITDTSFADWRRVMSVNLDGIFLGLKACLKAMIAHKKGGAIVLTASATGIKAQPNVGAYGASKAAIIHLGKIAAVEAAAHNIRVNIIAPGGVKTPIWHMSEGFDQMT